MDDAGLVRLGRELFMVTLGLPIQNIDSWALDRMIAMLEEQALRAGQVLYRTGEPADFFYFMREGQLRMTREGLTPLVLSGHWVVGGFEGLADAPHPRTATAVLTDISAMRVPVRGWVELLEDNFSMARGAVVNSTGSVAALEERIPVLPARDQTSDSCPAHGTGSLSLVERLALLVEVRMLRGAGVQTLGDLAGVTRESFFDPGATVLERGVDRTEMLLVVEGEVSASRESPHIVRRYGPGDIVCGSAAFGARAPFWQAKAVTRARVLSFPLEFWFDLMEEHFILVRSTMAAVFARRELLLEHLAVGQKELVLT